MKNLIPATLALLVFGLGMTSASGMFTSFHVFGDSLSCTASNTTTSQSLYYGKRYSNGRVWVEVLAQMQKLPFDPTNGNPHSFFGNTSSNLLAQISAYTPPADASNALVVIWVNNADFYYPVVGAETSLTVWSNLISASQANHYKAITNLYWSKRIGTLVMPNMVDVSTVPFASNSGSLTNLFHQQCGLYNAAFSNTLNLAMANCPGLVIYSPDYYSLLADLLAHPANYGVTNARYNYGSGPVSIDAVTDPNLLNKALNGPGTNYIFWDPTDPTAKVHNWMASLAQQMISPVKISKLTSFNGSNRLDLVNVPVGQNGFVVGSASLSSANWTTNSPITSTNTSQSVFVPASWPHWYYKVSFPVVWTWP